MPNPEAAPVVQHGRWFDRAELVATTAATYLLAACLGAEISVEASDITAGEMPQPDDLIVFGATIGGIVLFASWQHAHRKTMKQIAERSE